MIFTTIGLVIVVITMKLDQQRMRKQIDMLAAEIHSLKFPLDT